MCRTCYTIFHSRHIENHLYATDTLKRFTFIEVISYDITIATIRIVYGTVSLGVLLRRV